ncbi:hypothetical protein [Sandarakinorhabdus glacialis]|uniref:hypothetical protein n=1 Tax=Sandarakinorhabdus glacialis TaxID=1614636 RepID=UPI0016640866|nr:hypothetical protein [Polymorphobacter glacialis]
MLKQVQHDEWFRVKLQRQRGIAVTNNTIPWDAVNYLNTETDIAEYLAAASETGNPEDITHGLAVVARALTKKLSSRA